jgi:nitrilase
MFRSGQKVAAVQMTSGKVVSANLREAERLIRGAAEAGAGLVVLPENFAFMGERPEDVLSLRERDGDGPLQSFLSRTSAAHGVWLVGGTLPIAAGDGTRARAASLVFDERGERIARYDKMHLFDVQVPGADEEYRESAVIEPGDDVRVVDSPYGRLGLAVCYDLRFPEMFRRMLDLGMELLAVPSAFTAVTGKAHWESLVRARAIENLVYVIAAAQVGLHGNGRQTFGNSMIVDPWGAVLDHMSHGTGHVLHTANRRIQASLRQQFPAIAHRRLKCR